jgi:hypothetical protein
VAGEMMDRIVEKIKDLKVGDVLADGRMVIRLVKIDGETKNFWKVGDEKLRKKNLSVVNGWGSYRLATKSDFEHVMKTELEWKIRNILKVEKICGQSGLPLEVIESVYGILKPFEEKD